MEDENIVHHDADSDTSTFCRCTLQLVVNMPIAEVTNAQETRQFKAQWWPYDDVGTILKCVIIPPGWTHMT
jgi:hypothetical protein